MPFIYMAPGVKAMLLIGCLAILGQEGPLHCTGIELSTMNPSSEEVLKNTELNGANGFNKSNSNRRSVQFIRAVNFRQKSQRQNLKSLLFGKAKRKEVKPTSICRINKDRVCVTDTVNGMVIIIDNNGIIKKKLTHVKGIKIS